ncbi:hypothetical protein DIURU_001316 [Diutina rugosa]|uniref:Uncharacterized protein n=1 Tax=Diutina rugosa TaxID=5481 RepID=A0A642UWS5_DIURU|nr:uncharacterized protein DIURU_001316 [Diutina rugosa]KAA8905939.1 hypothetical protein DIURU_001316 [Diutina rugosa]
MPLQYSAAKSSSLRTPAKRRKLTPTQQAYIKASKRSTGVTEAKRPHAQRLEVKDYNVQLDYQLQRGSVLVAVNTVLDTQWSETTTLHSRYADHNPLTHKGKIVDQKTREDILFHFRGLSTEYGAKVLSYRRTLPELVTVGQLYSIFSEAGPTFVDKQLELLIRQGQLRKFIITNAAPVISRSLQKFHTGKITYGFENVEVVARAETYHALLKEHRTPTASKFNQFLTANPTALFVGPEHFDTAELDELVNLGFVTLTSNHLNEIETHQYSISYPGCGTFLKLINQGRAWLVKTLQSNKFHELLEDTLWSKYEGRTRAGVCQLKNFHRPFYGYDLNWILADALGAGVVEVFNTPVGRGWRLTGKV